MVRLLSMPMFLSAAASLLLALFFAAYFLRARHLFGESPRSTLLYAATAAAISLFLITFGVMVSADANLALLDFSARLTVIAATLSVSLLIAFIREFFHAAPLFSHRLLRYGNAAFILLALVSNPLFLKKARLLVSSHYVALQHGPGYHLWGTYMLLQMLYAIVLLAIVFHRVRRHDRVDRGAAKALIASCLLFLATGALDLLTSVQMIDLPPLTWLGALLVVAAIAWVLFVRLDWLFRDKTRLYELVIHDHQTQVYTRGFFEARLQETLRTLPRQPRELFVVKMDIDGFRAINHEYGRGCGDKVLRTVTAIARRLLRPGDVLARLSGDEFAFLVDRVGNQQHLLAIVQRLRDAIGKHLFREGERTFTATCSFGVAGFGGDAESVDEVCELIMKKADEALDGAKQSGKGAITLSFIE